MKKDVVCLYDEHGLSGRDWALAGYDVYCYDLEHKNVRIQNEGLGRIIFMPWDATDARQNGALIRRHKWRTAIVLAFPPCTDLAVSGSRHFCKKRQKDPRFQHKAMELVYTARKIGQSLKAPYCIENPISVISSYWRKPDYIFDPCDYGGYLPEDDEHPFYPSYIAARDAYSKKTCYWVGNGFIMPPKSPVKPEPGFSCQYKKLGGKSKKTKQIRSVSPRGISKAIFVHNSGGSRIQARLLNVNTGRVSCRVKAKSNIVYGGCRRRLEKHLLSR